MLVIVDEGQPTTLEIVLVCDRTSLGRRAWLQCECGSRRRHLYIDQGRLACRRCLRLHYREQLIPDSRWRREVARPALLPLVPDPSNILYLNANS